MCVSRIKKWSSGEKEKGRTEEVERKKGDEESKMPTQVEKDRKRFLGREGEKTDNKSVKGEEKGER